MGPVIAFFIIPVGIGYVTDKANKRNGPGWFIGFLVGCALYGAWLSLSGNGGDF
jgi:hypothetical protein